MIWFQVTDNGEGDEENESGYGGKTDQGEVDGAVKFAAFAAVLALDEVSLIVATHFREDAGDVVTPAGQDVSDDFVNALRLHAD